MSADMVDVVEAAEDMAASLASGIRRAFEATGPDAIDATDALRALLGEWDAYCRPTCGYRDDSVCLDGDCCGCPCGHEDDEPSESALKEDARNGIDESESTQKENARNRPRSAYVGNDTGETNL